MHPAPEDLAAGRWLAERIVAAGLRRVRRVVMIGSRAQGTARPDSDLDIVVVVETRADATPWNTADVVAERNRLQQVVGRPPVPTDLWVCTTDQFEEGRHTVGGIESLVETEGFDLYSEPFHRAPVVRRNRDQVRCANARGWLEQAVVACEQAAVDAPTRAMALSQRSIRAALYALLVAHQLRSSKHESEEAVATRVAGFDPAFAAWLRALFAAQWQTPFAAHTVLHAVVERLERDPGMPRLLASLKPRLVGAASRSNAKDAAPCRAASLTGFLAHRLGQEPGMTSRVRPWRPIVVPPVHASPSRDEEVS